MSPRTPLITPKTYFSNRGLKTNRLVELLTLILLIWPVLVGYGVSLVLVLRLDTGSNGLGGTLWSTAPSVLGQMLGSAIFLLLLLAGGIHLGTRLVSGQRGVVVSIQLAAWALVPAVVATVVTLPIMYIALGPATGYGSSSSIFEAATAQMRSLGLITTVISLVTVLWSGVIIRYGLEYEHRLTSTAARAITGVLVAVMMLGVIS